MADGQTFERERIRVSVKTVLVVAFTLLGVAAAAAFAIITRRAIALTVGAVLIAIAMDHVVRAAMRWLHLKRGLALTLVLVLTFGSIVGGVLLLGPAAVKQGHNLVEEAPSYAQHVRQSPLYQKLNKRFQLNRQIEEQVTGTPPQPEKPGQEAQQKSAGVVATVAKGIGGAVAVVVDILSVGFLVIFMLLSGEALVRNILNLTSEERRGRYERVLSRIYDSVGGYLMGLGLICAVNATLTSTFLAIARVPFFLPLGILSGFSSLVPYAGPLFMGTTITLLVLVTKGTWVALATAVYFILYGQLEGNVIGPMMFRRTVHLNPLVTLLALLFMADFAGVLGAVIAVPTAASLQMIIREIRDARRDRKEAEQLGRTQSPTPVPPSGGLPVQRPLEG